MTKKTALKSENQVAVALIVRGNQGLTDLEKQSLLSINENTQGLSRNLIYPESNPPLDENQFIGWEKLPASDNFFGSPKAYSGFLLDPTFYSMFFNYNRVIVLHLDVCLFRKVAEFDFEDYDYIGAPWVRYTANREPYFVAAGNGGLSARVVDRHFKLLNLKVRPFFSFKKSSFSQSKSTLLALLTAWHFTLRKTYSEFGKFLIKRGLHEDVFISRVLPALDTSFKVAGISKSLSFAWEEDPAFCSEYSKIDFPVGCHKWWHYDPCFIKKINQGTTNL